MSKIYNTEIFTRKDGQVGLRIVSPNGETIFGSEGYKNTGHAERLAEDFANKCGGVVHDLRISG